MSGVNLQGWKLRLLTFLKHVVTIVATPIIHTCNARHTCVYIHVCVSVCVGEYTYKYVCMYVLVFMHTCVCMCW